MIEYVHTAQFMKQFSKVNMAVWIAMIPISTITGWVKSSEFISYLSIYALFIAAFSSYVGTRVESKQEQKEKSS